MEGVLTQKTWREAYPEKYRESQKKSYEKYKEARLLKMREYYQLNRERIIEQKMAKHRLKLKQKGA